MPQLSKVTTRVVRNSELSLVEVLLSPLPPSASVNGQTYFVLPSHAIFMRMWRLSYFCPDQTTYEGFQIKSNLVQ